MLDFIKSIFSGDQGPILQVVAIVSAFNAVLYSISAALDVVKDKTSSDFDNRAADLIHKIASVVQKILDLIVGNKEHKKPEE